MKDARTHVEPGELASGGRAFRWVCDCGKRGVWLQDLTAAERNGRIHEKHEHPRTAVA